MLLIVSQLMLQKTFREFCGEIYKCLFFISVIKKYNGRMKLLNVWHISTKKNMHKHILRVASNITNDILEIGIKREPHQSWKYSSPLSKQQTANTAHTTHSHNTSTTINQRRKASRKLSFHKHSHFGSLKILCDFAWKVFLRAPIQLVEEYFFLGSRNISN